MRGQESVDCPRGEIKPALARTLGVPIFQEQVKPVAILAAGFTPGEADALLRAMAAWKRKGGLAHIVFGLTRFRVPLLEAPGSGLVGQFAEPEVRRTAFWFLMVGPLLMLIGQLCVRAVDSGDLQSLRIVGVYLFCFSLVGIAAFPVSPFWAALIISLLFIAVGSKQVS